MESIYIIDISIYLDLPARGTDRQMYRLSIERIIIKERDRERQRETDRQTDSDRETKRDK